MINIKIERTEITDWQWEHIVDEAADLGIDLSRSSGCHLTVMDIEPSAPHVENIEILEEEDA